MSARMLGSLAIVAVAVGLSWCALTRHDDASSGAAVRRPRSTDLTPPTPPPRPAATPAPVSPAAATAEILDPREAAFTNEPREDAWASRTERELRARFQAMRGGRLAEVECRARQCRVLVAGSQAELGKTINELGGSHGLHGYADQVELTPPVERPDGSFALRAFTLFRR